MTGVVPNNPPVLPNRCEISSNKHDFVGSVTSTISVLTPLPDGYPVATMYRIIPSKKEKHFLNGFDIAHETHPNFLKVRIMVLCVNPAPLLNRAPVNVKSHFLGDFF